jgi:integrase
MPAAAVGTVLAYLVDYAGALKVSTLQRRLAAVREAHRYAGIELDTSSVAFRDTWRGLRRAHAQPVNKKAPLLTAILRRAVAGLGDGLMGCRDRALLLIGFAAALRRSELAGLEAVPRDGAAGWIEETSDGLLIQLRANFWPRFHPLSPGSSSPVLFRVIPAPGALRGGPAEGGRDVAGHQWWQPPHP